MSDQPTQSAAPPDRPAHPPGTPDAGSTAAGPAGEAGGADRPPAPAGYELLEEVGSGGMGVVYRAHDAVLRRDVALKVLQARYPADGPTARRFVEESQITGQLQHPGIPPVHAVGALPDGRPFLAMKLVKGQTLEAMLGGRTSPAADRGRFLSIFERVCEAVAFAHDRRVIHRDLKPANVMVGNHGEVQVMDWGLAKVLTDRPEAPAVPRPAPGSTEIRTFRDDDGSATQAGSILGTPAFMPPEQAGGEVGKVDERADVFGLGAILCVILTGRPPYAGPDADAVRLMAIRGELDECHARLDGCGAGPELIGLCKRCLARAPAGRPATADAVAAEVVAFRTAAEDRARRADLERARAEVQVAEQRKRRRVQALLGMAFTTLIALVGFGLWWSDRKAAERQQDRDRAAAELAAREAVTDRDVSAALTEAEAYAAQAWRQADDPDRMQSAADLARESVRRAEAALTVGAPTADVRRRVAGGRAAADDLARHPALLVALDRIRNERAEAFQPNLHGYDNRPTPGKYAAAYRAFGLDPVADPAGTATVIRTSRVRDRLTDGLRDWARHLRDEGAYNRLLETYDAIDPNPDAFTRRWRAAIRDRAGLVEFARTVTVDQLTPAAAVHLAEDLFRLEAPDAGVRLLKAVVERYPGDFWAQLTLGYNAGGADARTHYAAARALRPRNPWAAVLWAATFPTAPAHLGEAERAWREALALDPKYVRARCGLANVLWLKKDADGAIAEYREAIRSDAWFTSFMGAYANLAAILRARGDLDGAAAECRAGLAARPESVGERLGLAQVLEAKGDPDGALAELREAVRINPKAAQAGGIHTNLGARLRDGGKADEAMAVFRDAIRINPKAQSERFALGVLLLSRKDLDAALVVFGEIIDLAPKDAVAHDFVAFLWLAKEDPRAALPFAEKAVQFGPDAAQRWWNLGRARLGTGDAGGAEAAFREGLNCDPRHPGCTSGLAAAREAQAARGAERGPPPREVKKPE
jgi:eukaryotic-like serine/threonine-protein kinase